MYIPNLYREDDVGKLVALIRQHSFATVVTAHDGRPLATHLPLTVATAADGIVLRGHFAKANPHWGVLAASETMAIFTGPHAYVSPTHYDELESVPTWDYLAVHAYGHARVIDGEADPQALHALLYELIEEHEPSYREQWDELSDRYRDGMMRGIVGFELPVERLEGVAKLSQNKSHREQERIAAALLESEDSLARATGAEMRVRLGEDTGHATIADAQEGSAER